MTECNSAPCLAASMRTGSAGEEALENDVGLHADHGVVRARHAAIGLVRRAAGQNASVGRRHVSVRADHGGYAAVQIPAHRHLLAGHLGVKIHESSL